MEPFHVEMTLQVTESKALQPLGLWQTEGWVAAVDHNRSKGILTPEIIENSDVQESR